MIANQTKVEQRQEVAVTDGLGTVVFQGVFYGSGLFGTVLVGAWAASCLVGGMIAAGGPAKLALSWFQATTGI
ncbi:hypothetical protein [Desulfofustis limnaeus]|uniref:Uncharacterized protein n=1 Tax=Desulfofustis limnaeus TaxID=2740163 RepID=A0ABN6M4Z8_9BACT|nr:hypothetical protein [Desulfofustis limnaeus]MDX9895614.1 hypothetical protein [Desulfofustis sp.]BDD87976.1 hypothetical protein DPPLL_23410 [Desulfofustis limnaeus]